MLNKSEDAMNTTLQGIVHGKTIELDEDPGIADGQKVQVQIAVWSAKKKLPGPPPGWKPGQPSKTAGLLADCWTEENDRILEEIYRDRKRETKREIPE
jgi:hypothetical protein